MRFIYFITCSVAVFAAITSLMTSSVDYMLEDVTYSYEWGFDECLSANQGEELLIGTCHEIARDIR